MLGAPEYDEQSLVALQLAEVEVPVAARGNLRRVRSLQDRRVVSVALYSVNLGEDLRDGGSNGRYLQIIASLSFSPKNLHPVYKESEDPRYL